MFQHEKFLLIFLGIASNLVVTGCNSKSHFINEANPHNPDRINEAFFNSQDREPKHFKWQPSDVFPGSNITLDSTSIAKEKRDPTQVEDNHNAQDETDILWIMKTRRMDRQTATIIYNSQPDNWHRLHQLTH
jgi:hypothetical protein